MCSQDKINKIKWAPRAKKEDIAEVYKLNAIGMDDEIKIDNLGITLYLRCTDILCVKRAREGGGLRCYACRSNTGLETYISYNGHFYKGMEEVTLTCPVCGFSFTNAEFYKSFKNKQLHSGGAVPAFEHFMTYYPVEKDMNKKLLLIDRLINSFHYSLKHSPDVPTRSVGPNLIEGRLKDILLFLDELSL